MQKPSCNHEPRPCTDGSRAHVQIRRLARRHGQLLLGLVCINCDEVFDSRWFPDALGCLASSASNDHGDEPLPGADAAG